MFDNGVQLQPREPPLRPSTNWRLCICTSWKSTTCCCLNSGKSFGRKRLLPDLVAFAHDIDLKGYTYHLLLFSLTLIYIYYFVCSFVRPSVHPSFVRPSVRPSVRPLIVGWFVGSFVHLLIGDKRQWRWCLYNNLEISNNDRCIWSRVKTIIAVRIGFSWMESSETNDTSEVKWD